MIFGFEFLPDPTLFDGSTRLNALLLMYALMGFLGTLLTHVIQRVSSSEQPEEAEPQPGEHEMITD